jgi:hypothetical protein
VRLAFPSRTRDSDRASTARARDLLALASLTEDGVLTRTDDAVVRYLELLPRNPLVMDEAEAERTGHGFASLLARLPAGQALQVHVHASPVALDELVADYRAQVELALAPIESRAPARAAALRELAEVHVESLHVHTAEHAAVRVRYLLVVPVSEQTGSGWAGALARSRTRGRVGLARMSLALVDALRSELEGLDMGVRILDGPEVADVLFGRFAPAMSADQPALAPSRRPTILPAGPTAEDQEASARAARRLGEAIAQADIDAADRRWLGVDGGLEQTIHLSGSPDATFFGWLLHAMQSPTPGRCRSTSARSTAPSSDGATASATEGCTG